MKYLIRVVAIIITCSLCGNALAVEVLNFAPSPVSPTIDEFQWDGNQLNASSGLSSNGDGNLLGGSGEATPGLILSTPFTITGVSSSQNNTDGSTTFYDASMTISGFLASSPAGQVGDTMIQPLTGGSFSVYSSSDTVGGAELLLAGTLTNAVITAVAGEDTGSVLSATITYTSGLVYDALVAAGLSPTGSLSWALIDIQPDLSIDPQTGNLRPFGADATGGFDARIAPAAEIPAPAAFPVGLLLMGIVGAVHARRARRG